MSHPLAGRQQSPEHVAKRVASVARTKAAWSSERHAVFVARTAEANRRRGPETRRRISQSKMGNTPWNKGNNWREKHTPEEVRAIAARRARRLRERRPEVRLHQTMSTQIRIALKNSKSGWRWESLVGYSRAELEAHLKITIPAGYSWADLGRRLDIDHIVPVSAHNFTSADDIKRCWALSNLQLLPTAENRRKNNRLSAPFQPALAFGAAA